jgi:hypothetical protein
MNRTFEVHIDEMFHSAKTCTIAESSLAMAQFNASSMLEDER